MSFRLVNPDADSLRRAGALAACCLVWLSVCGCATNDAFRAGEKAERAAGFRPRGRRVHRGGQGSARTTATRASALAARAAARLPGNISLRAVASPRADRHRTGAGRVPARLRAQSDRSPGRGCALRETRQRLRNKIAVSRGGKTELQTLVDRTRDLPPPGLDLPDDATLPDSLRVQLREQPRRLHGVRALLRPEHRLRPGLPRGADHRRSAQGHARQRAGVGHRRDAHVLPRHGATHDHDHPGYARQASRIRRVGRPDVLLEQRRRQRSHRPARIVVDVRQISPITATNAISLKDTPERIAAATKLIAAIDKARPEVIIDVELLEVDRTRAAGIRARAGVARAPTASPVRGRQQPRPDAPGSAHSHGVGRRACRRTRHLLSTAEERREHPDAREPAAAHVRRHRSSGQVRRAGPDPGDDVRSHRIGGVNQQPITSFNYENIGVNIDILPRMHHDDEVSLTLKIALSSISGDGFRRPADLRQP